MLGAALLGATAACAIGPALLFVVNLWRYRAPEAVGGGQRFSLSVLIPARNEEANIGAALEAVLASRGVDLEVLVLDDDSADRTGEMVQALAAADSRLRLLQGRGLPPGWNGKQHACWTLAGEATRPLLIFLDADVRVAPELFARMAAFGAGRDTALVSGFPRLITVTWLEKLLLPLIHFVLLAFLPMRAMRRHTWPSAAAGCGQFMLAEREAYFACGGHSAIRETMHDGLLLPRVFRRAGYKTDIADITDFASVRMYDSAAKVWSGLAKNATEGIATVGKIVPLSLILLLGQVMPALYAAFLLCSFLLVLLFQLFNGVGLSWLVRFNSSYLISLFLLAHEGAHSSAYVIFCAVCFLTLACVYLPRLLAVRRFQQPLSSALLHPVGIFLLLCVQWYALLRKLVGKPVGWRQRTYSSETGTQVG